MRAFPAAHYVLYEPQAVHSDALDQFQQSHGASVTAVKKAVGGAEGETFFDATDPFSGALSRTGVGEHMIRVPQTTIDASQKHLGTSGPYLLKLDTHGYEKSILEGAESTLRNTEALVVEVYNYRFSDEALLFWEICSFLGDRGFRPIDLVDVMHRTRDRTLWQMDLFFIRDSWKGFECGSYT